MGSSVQMATTSCGFWGDFSLHVCCCALVRFLFGQPYGDVMRSKYSFDLSYLL